MADQILKLQTKKVRRFIEIDDKQYTMREMKDLSLTDQHDFKIRSKRIAKMQKDTDTELTAEQVADVTECLNKIVSAILPELREVINVLTDEDKIAIMNNFLAAPAASTTNQTDAGTSFGASLASATTSGEPSATGSEVLAG